MDKVCGKTVRKRIQCLNFLISVKIPQNFFETKYLIISWFTLQLSEPSGERHGPGPRVRSLIQFWMQTT